MARTLFFPAASYLAKCLKMSQSSSAQTSFLPRTSVAAVEEGKALMPRFDQDGLIVAVVTDATDDVVLMIGYMNAEALRKTMDTGYAHFWSRSRQKLWRKGETSNHSQKIVELRIDDDQDALWLKVEVGASGASCHVGYRSCFYRRIEPTKQLKDCLQFTEHSKTFDPQSVYKGKPNPTNL